MVSFFNKKRQEMIKGLLIGNPVDKSVSHVTHNEIFKKNNLKAIYEKKKILEEDFLKEIGILKKSDYSFFAITMPYKQRIMPFLDERNSKLESCNTIIVKNGKWIGYNFDGIGCLNAIEKRLKVRNKKVLVVGAGGAAIAAIDEAIKRGAIVFVWNRTFEKVLKLTEIFPINHAHKLEGDFDVIIQSTSCGMLNDFSIVPEIMLKPSVLAIDMVYSPHETLFLKEAKKRACEVVYGFEMFAELTYLQLNLVFGSQLDKEIVFSEVKKIFIKN
jgi:3-dehydroquinate dehydratase/shikimate dehydrogenase